LCSTSSGLSLGIKGCAKYRHMVVRVVTLTSSCTNPQSTSSIILTSCKSGKHLKPYPSNVPCLIYASIFSKLLYWREIARAAHGSKYACVIISHRHYSPCISTQHDSQNQASCIPILLIEIAFTHSAHECTSTSSLAATSLTTGEC